VQNYNKNLENKIDDIYNLGPHLINDAIERKFNSHKLIDNKKTKIDGANDDKIENEPETKNDDDEIDELLITPPNTPPDTKSDTPLEPPPNIQSPQPPPEPRRKLTNEEKKELSDNKEYNKKLNSIIKTLNKDIKKNGDSLTTDTKTFYKGMFKTVEVKFSNATKSKTSLINSLSSQKKKI
jgi:hypothetical protein